MSNQWLIGVIDDLHIFAERNSMPALAGFLEEALVAARSEMMGHEVAKETSYYELPVEIEGVNQYYKEARRAQSNLTVVSGHQGV